MEETNKSTHIIELSKIVKLFKVKLQDILVLKEVDLKIDRNDFIIIFGPSGCGKSTLLHVIVGLEKPTSGRANFFGYEIYKLKEDGRSQFRKNHIGMVYQQANWIKSLNVIENVAFSLSLMGLEKAEAIEKARLALEEVGMADWANYHPTELSSGQQQKVSFARAIVADPKVIIADEPTGNLDYQSGVDVLNLFKKYNQQGKTVIMVTHDPDGIDYATKVVQMFDGRIVEIHKITKSNLSKVKKQLIEKKSLRLALEKNEEKDSLLIDRYKTKDVNLVVKKKSIFHIPTLPNMSSIKNWLNRCVPTIKDYARKTKEIIFFIALLFIYLSNKLLKKIYGKRIYGKRIIPKKISDRLIPSYKNIYEKLINFFQLQHLNNISRLELIDLSLKNMLARKTRSLITIGGMAIGIASIVFLVSLGYGVERLVISRVARLDEMRQIDAIPAVASNLKITDKTVSKIQNINSVKKVLPIIGLVGKVNFNNSNTDVAVYGVLADYLKESAIKPSQGKIFASNEGFKIFPSETGKAVVKKIDIENTEQKGDVAGASIKKGNEEIRKASYKRPIKDVVYKILPDKFVRVRKNPRKTARILGYTRRIEGVQDGVEVWGDTYIDNPAGQAGVGKDGENFGKWIKSKIPLWEKVDCDSQEDSKCEQGKYIPLLDEEGRQVFENGYFAEIGMQIVDDDVGAVLGTATESASLASSTASQAADLLTTLDNESTDEADLIIKGLLEDKTVSSVNKVQFKQGEKRVAVVNKSLLTVLGITSGGIGKKFDISFIATGSLVDNKERVESHPIEYEIIGITPDTKTPIVYVPLLDLNELGLGNYSQIKIVVENKNQIAQTRKQIEVLGLSTSSVVDTVAEIEGLFATVRLLLGLLGVVALSVAALGMFNTLTISLMERTHEVGMMKAIGMKSDEVKDLFLTESMIMGVFGGIGGLLLGYAFGNILSILISSIAIVRGFGYINISYVPFMFTLVIIILSLFVGLVTGIYPARRATKISALDALRYE